MNARRSASKEENIAKKGILSIRRNRRVNPELQDKLEVQLFMSTRSTERRSCTTTFVLNFAMSCFPGRLPKGPSLDPSVKRLAMHVESEDVAEALSRGDLKFVLHGKKLRGSWVLVRTRGFGSKADKSWLLIKHRDRFASTKDVTVERPQSAVSNRLLVQIARDGGGDVEKASTGDPTKKRKKESTNRWGGTRMRGRS